MAKTKYKSLIETYDLVVYPIKVAVAIGYGLKDIINKRYVSPDEEYKDAVIVYPKDCDACTYFLMDRKSECFISLIWAEEPAWFTGSKMSHEATHAALDIFKHIHADVDFDNQEPFAYLQGAIMRAISKTYFKVMDKTNVEKQ